MVAVHLRQLWSFQSAWTGRTKAPIQVGMANVADDAYPLALLKAMTDPTPNGHRPRQRPMS